MSDGLRCLKERMRSPASRLNKGGTEVPIRRWSQLVEQFRFQSTISCPFGHVIAPIGELRSFAMVKRGPVLSGAGWRESDGSVFADV